MGPEAGATAAGEPGEPSAMRLLGRIGHVGHCPMVSCPAICWNLAKKTAIYTLGLRDAQDSFLPRCSFFFSSRPPSPPTHRSPPCQCFPEADCRGGKRKGHLPHHRTDSWFNPILLQVTARLCDDCPGLSGVPGERSARASPGRGTEWPIVWMMDASPASKGAAGSSGINTQLNKDQG